MTLFHQLNEAQLRALTSRADLLEAECRLVQEQRCTWAGRAAALEGYGWSGGSAMDRRLVAEAMAQLEAGGQCRACGGDGVREQGTTQDSFGVWETVEVVCECQDRNEPEDHA